jgi:hypothetical protein
MASYFSSLEKDGVEGLADVRLKEPCKTTCLPKQLRSLVPTSLLSYLINFARISNERCLLGEQGVPDVHRYYVWLI